MFGLGLTATNVSLTDAEHFKKSLPQITRKRKDLLALQGSFAQSCPALQKGRNFSLLVYIHRNLGTRHT